MVNLAKLKTGVLLVLLTATLASTFVLLVQTNPALGNAAQPNIPCEGYVCYLFRPCAVVNPPAVARVCNNACWVGDYLRCMDPGGWRCSGPCPDY